MASLNKVILIGNLTADPEVKQTQSGLSVVSFTIAVNRRVSKDAEQKTDFINIVAWRKTAEFVGQYFKKGKPILVCGAIQTRSYTDKSGNKRISVEVLADEVGFVESKAASEAPSGTYEPEAYGAPKMDTWTVNPNESGTDPDDDLPF